MSYDMNNISIIGRLTKDPALNTKASTPVCNFSIAVNNGKEDKDVSFFNVTAFSNTANIISQYMTKGMRLGIVGKLQQDRWEDSDGNNKSAIKIIANSVFFLESKSENNSNKKSTTNKAAKSEHVDDSDLPF